MSGRRRDKVGTSQQGMYWAGNLGSHTHQLYIHRLYSGFGRNRL